MKIIGVTGGIASGKSTALAMFKDLGCAVWSADAAVHDLYAHNATVFAFIEKHFPQSIENGAISRARLGDVVFHNLEGLQKLESLIHPLVAEHRAVFLKAHEGDALVALEIPLLFEKELEKTCDVILLVYCDEATQRQRLMLRPFMTTIKAEAILKSQMPLDEKLKRVHYAIDSTLDIDAMHQKIKNFLESV